MDETMLARTLFKDSINYLRVRVHNGKWAPFQPDSSGITPNGEIWAHGNAYKGDYGADPKVENKAFFIHEMVHVWQSQNRVIPVIISAISEFIEHWGNYKSAYLYKLEANKDLSDYQIEQQAAIIENYYRLKHGGPLRTEYLRNTEQGSALLQLHEAILQRFLKDPGYARDHMDRMPQPERGWVDR